MAGKNPEGGIYFRLSPKQVGSALAMYTVALGMLYWSHHETRWELKVMRMQLHHIAKQVAIDIGENNQSNAVDPP